MTTATTILMMALAAAASGTVYGAAHENDSSRSTTGSTETEPEKSDPKEKSDLAPPNGFAESWDRFHSKESAAEKGLLEKAKDAYDKSPVKGWAKDGTIGVKVEVKFRKDAPTSRVRPASLPPGVVWKPEGD